LRLDYSLLVAGLAFLFGAPFRLGLTLGGPFQLNLDRVLIVNEFLVPIFHIFLTLILVASFILRRSNDVMIKRTADITTFDSLTFVVIAS